MSAAHPDLNAPGRTIATDPAKAMQLYDTARRAVVPFLPGDTVSMYTCGITPYDATHLGPRGHVPHLRHPAASPP
jgi:hypothetical protein